MPGNHLVVGLTGGIGSGKSEALRAFRRLGARTICLDEIAHQVLRRGAAACAPVARAFGRRILARGGGIDRRALGRIVFNSPRLRLRLERLTHPAILARMRRERTRARGLLVVDAPLLFEAGLEREFDVTVVMTAALGTRLKRLKRRDGLPAAELRRRLAAQLPQALKARRADIVVSNDATRGELRRKIREYHRAFQLMHGG